MMKILTDITIQPPEGTYFQILSCSGLLKHGFETKGGTIDRDYNGNVVVIMRNKSDTLCTRYKKGIAFPK
jgi:dUTPase